jgi:FixJ family two-component response regulator
MTAPGSTVFLVDDDKGVLKALSRLLRTAGHEVRAFDRSRAFLDEHDPSVPGCVVLDLAIPDLDGLQLQSLLAKDGSGRAVIFLTGRGDIPTSVRAMKAGAVDFLTKPVKAGELLSAISRAMERDDGVRRARSTIASIESRLSRLTAREREVLGHVIAGRLNKQIAGDLGTALKTIKVHRGRIMQKLGVRTVADLVRLAERAGIEPHRRQ